MLQVFISFLFVGCSNSDRGSLEQATIFAIGDSIFEWHLGDGQSAPDCVGNQLGQSVYNASISGAKMTSNRRWGIPNQYIEGD